MSTPDYKVFRNDEYIACFRYLEDAAAFVSTSSGFQVRWGHAKRDTLWTEGSETFSAYESYDQAAEVMRHRQMKLATMYAEKANANSYRSK